MTTVIVLGMHRTRTSLVSRICVELGVNMGDDLLGTHPSQPHGHWEDREFYQLNECILHGCSENASWDRPPAIDLMEWIQGGCYYTDDVKGLVAKKDKNPLWGWKDPRTCLTLPIYWPYLTDVKLLFTKRNQVSTIRSLMSRSGGNRQKWERVIGVYEEGVNWAREHGVPQLVVDTDRLVNRSFSKVEIGKMARFLGRPVSLIDKAARVVAFS